MSLGTLRAARLLNSDGKAERKPRVAQALDKQAIHEAAGAGHKDSFHIKYLARVVPNDMETKLVLTYQA